MTMHSPPPRAALPAAEHSTYGHGYERLRRHAVEPGAGHHRHGLALALGSLLESLEGAGRAGRDAEGRAVDVKEILPHMQEYFAHEWRRQGVTAAGKAAKSGVHVGYFRAFSLTGRKKGIDWALG